MDFNINHRSGFSYILVTLLVLLVLVGAASANTYNATITGTLPPASGDWIISNYTNVTDGWVQMEPLGNISVASGGTLHILGNTTIEFQTLINASNKISISSGGNLTIDSAHGKDNYIQTNSTAKWFEFYINSGAVGSIKNTTFYRPTRIFVGADGYAFKNTTLDGGSGVYATSNGFLLYANPAGSVTVTIEDSEIYDTTEAILSYGHRPAVFKISNCLIGKSGKYVAFGIAHPYTGSVIENNTFTSISTVALYLDRRDMIVRHNKGGSVSEYAGTGSINYYNNSMSITIINADSNSIIHDVDDAHQINVKNTPQPYLQIHNITYNTLNAWRVITRSNITIQDIVGTVSSHGYQLEANTGKTLTIINETGTIPSGNYAHYILTDDSCIIKKHRLTLNITDLNGNPVIATIDCTDNSSVQQNATSATKTTIELPYIKYGKSSGLSDNITKSTSEYCNYIITITNASYSNSPYTTNLAMNSEQNLNIDLGNYDGGSEIFVNPAFITAAAAFVLAAAAFARSGGSWLNRRRKRW